MSLNSRSAVCRAGLTGPFKLRELIGFAVRGMVPTDAMIKSDVSKDWIPIERIRMLRACFSGDMVLLGEGGKTHPDNRVPVRPKSIDITRSTAAKLDESESDSDLLIVGDEGLVIEEDAAEESETDAPNRRREQKPSPRSRRVSGPSVRIPLPGLPRFLTPRLLVNVLGLLVVVAGIGAAYSYWRNMSMSSDAIVGDWIGGGNAGAPNFGITFGENGRCVIFDSEGESWSGDYAWATRNDDSAGFQEIDPISADVDKLDAGYQSGPVKPKRRLPSASRLH